MTARITSPTTTPRELRFQFGKNWARFLSVLDDERIAEAERSLSEMLEVTNLRGRSFLDVGSGSGLFSLAAKRLGAARVHSFDYDPDSVACTREIKRRFFPDDGSWTVVPGSVLDVAFLRSLGRFDIVYSWGVLHHTGDLWTALGNVTDLVDPTGKLFIAIYNDQGSASRRWRAIKRLYNRSPALLRLGLVALVGAYSAGRVGLGNVLRWQSPLRVASISKEKKKDRGMSLWHDLVDWVGGYPFEVATPEEVFDFCRRRGFAMQRLKTVGGGLGNNQYVFVKTHLRR
jgi:2-polyprenyl-6-hydroxyphenyl methylase/3-demethylubiquinone-9 3-methyltransferase